MKTEDDNSKGGDPGSDASWLERNVNVVIAGLVVACIASLIAQLWWAPLFAEKHTEASHVETSHDDGSHAETAHDEHAHDEHRMMALLICIPLNLQSKRCLDSRQCLALQRLSELYF